MKGNISRENFHKLWMQFMENSYNPKKYRPRGGIIPYTIWKGEIWYILGIDYDYQTVTDFGGGYEDEDHTLIATSFREFYEESLDVFKPYYEISNYDLYFNTYKPNGCQTSPHLHLYLKLESVDPSIIKEHFLKKYKQTRGYLECVDIIAIKSEDMIDGLKTANSSVSFKNVDDKSYKMWSELYWQLFDAYYTSNLFHD